MWSPNGSSRRVHLEQRDGGRVFKGMPRILRMARGKEAGGRGGSRTRGWTGKGSRTHEMDEGREERRRRSLAGADERREV